VYNSATACEEKADRVFGLVPFTTLECGHNQTNAHSYDRIRFNFLPLADATNDIFRVKFVLLAENTDLDDASSRRRLRSITHYQVLNSRKRLSSTSSFSAAASGLALQQPSYNTADDAAPAPAPAAPAAPASPAAPAAEPSAPVKDESVMDVGHKHELETDTFLWIIVAAIIVVVVVGLLYWTGLGRKMLDAIAGCCCSKKDGSSGSMDGSGEGGFAAVGFREKRFSP